MKLTPLIYHFVIISVVQASITDYFRNALNYFNSEKSDTQEIVDLKRNVPYELSLTDEKFIEEAIKLTGVDKSELDSCQHRVVLQLQTACHKMNDEQLAKMAVMLLNCQSIVEAREIYPCTESMTLKDCTSGMDSIAWNTYHIMSNRARAVCYYVRNVQFRGLTEQTVNKLMHSAQLQIKKLQELSSDQHDLHDVTKETLHVITNGYKDLHSQQEDIRKAQFHNQLSLEDNIRRLIDEKFLIKENKELLATLTSALNIKLENALKQLDAQSEQNKLNHKELINDILRIQGVTNTIFAQIDKSSKMLIEQNHFAQLQLNLTIESLKQMNSTVSSLVNIIGGTKQALEERLSWITEILGGTDIAVERLYIVMWHFGFLTGGMILCAFLNANMSTRIVVFSLVPVNMALYFNDNDQYLSPMGLIQAMSILLIVQGVILYVLKLKQTKATSGMLTNGKIFDKHSSHDISYKAKTVQNKDEYDLNETAHSFNDFLDTDTEFLSPTPPLSAKNEYLHNSSTFLSPTPSISSRNGISRSRSRTPQLNRSFKSPCQAITRIGTPCKLSSLPGRDYCYKHQNGDSVMG